MDQDMRHAEECAAERLKERESYLAAEHEKTRQQRDEWRERAEIQERRARYAEGEWAAACAESTVLRREVARLRALLVDADPRWMRDADVRSCDMGDALERCASGSDAERRARIDRARERFERLTRAEPAFGPASLCEVRGG
jgi:hypothetical protein